MKIHLSTFNSNMKLFVTRIVGFIFIIILIFSVINFFQSQYNNAPSFYKTKYIAINNNSVNYDSIIIGSSHILNSIKPSIIKSSNGMFYNFALNGAGSKFYYDWYLNIFTKNRRSPKMILFGIDWFIFDEKWLWRKIEHDAEYFNNLMFYQLLFSPNNLDKTCLIENRIPFFKYRNLRLSLNRKDVDEKYPPNSYDYGYVATKTPFNSLKFISKEKENINLIQVYYFKKIISKMISDKCKIIFVMPPEFKLKISKYRNSKSLYIIQKTASNYNIPILNFNTNLRSSLNENINYFDDWGHLNNKGAIEFSTYLSKELNYILKK